MTCQLMQEKTTEILAIIDEAASGKLSLNDKVDEVTSLIEIR